MKGSVRVKVRGLKDARDHLLEAFHRSVYLRPRGDVVLDFVDERREGDTAGVGGRIFAAESIRSRATCLASDVLSYLWTWVAMAKLP